MKGPGTIFHTKVPMERAYLRHVNHCPHPYTTVQPISHDQSMVHNFYLLMDDCGVHDYHVLSRAREMGLQ